MLYGLWSLVMKLTVLFSMSSSLLTGNASYSEIIQPSSMGILPMPSASEVLKCLCYVLTKRCNPEQFLWRLSGLYVNCVLLCWVSARAGCPCYMSTPYWCDI